jgi:Flp pilus assembly CpaF family ATPase
MANHTDNTLHDFARNSQAGRDLERLVSQSRDIRSHYKQEQPDQKNLPLLEQQRDILIHYLYTRDLDFLRSVPSEHETRARLAKVIQQGDVERLAVNIREAIEAVIVQLYHYGLLQPLMDESKEFITDIWVFGTYGVMYRERGQNRWFLDDKGERLRFSSHEELRQFVERKFGSDFNLDLSAPSVNAIFPDGSRILYREKACGYSAWINGKYELFLNEPMLIIRRFGHAYLLDELMETGMFTPRMQAYLELIPRLHEKFLIGGATGVGKSTLQNAMLAYLSQTEVTGMLEDTPDAKIPGGFYVRFYTQEANGEGKGEITIARNLYDAKRANFQNVIVNEMRDGATGMRATDVAMMTSGSFGSTIHAVTIENMINVYTSMLMSAPERPNRAYASELFVAAFQKLISVEIVHQIPMITAIGEVMGMVGERVQWQPVFERQYKARRVLFHGLSEATIERAYKYDIEIPESLQQPGEETF